VATKTDGQSSGRSPWHLRRLRQLDRAVRRRLFPKSKCDVYHEPNYLPYACGVPTVTTFHDLSIIRNPKWHPRDRVERFEKNLPISFELTNHFITDTEAVRSEMVEILGIPAEKITRVWCGIRDD